MERVRVDELQVVVLVDETREDSKNRKGSLLEAFFARILETLGYEEPTTSSLNVTSGGVEIDVVAKKKVMAGLAIAECKAYSAPVPAHMLNAFYGKLAGARLDAAHTAGFFIALPKLTSPGEEQARRFEQGDDEFRYLNSRDVADLLRQQKLVVDAPPHLGATSDPLVLITDDGVFQAAHRLDPSTRTADALVVWSAHPVPDSVIAMLRSSNVADGLSVVRAEERSPASAVHDDPLIVRVSESTSDFEYQLPAAPKYFVGRRREIGLLKSRLLDPTSAVIVLNAQSGWGKSSLALRMSQEVARAKGRALILDTRTASTQGYVPAALRDLASVGESAGILQLPPDAAFATISSSLETLKRSTWHQPDRPLLLFFDQFENVFRDPELTRSFRDLALAVGELDHPLKVGFAWKTDLVGWTESHPYQLRDEIRSSSYLVALEPLGPSEISTLLKRLEGEIGRSLGRDMRDRLREYSGGLPWLFKKLAGHIIREVADGRTEEQLLAGALNVQGLFEADLAELSLAERDVLKKLARAAPVAISEMVDTVDLAVVQSLLDRRLIVQVGERLDTYWDIFRDYLNTGSVPIKDGYVLRLNPSPSMGVLLRTAIDHDGELLVSEAMGLLRTSETVVFNAVRDLRLLGLVSYEPGLIRIPADVQNAVDAESALQSKAQAALRRHRAYDVVQSLLDTEAGNASMASFARQLSLAFPAVKGKEATWNSYARAFSSWLAYAGLIGLTPTGISNDPSDTVADLSLLSREGRVAISGAFPHSAAGPAIEAATQLAKGLTPPFATPRAKAGLRALRALSLVGDSPPMLTSTGRRVFQSDGSSSATELRAVLEEQIAGATAALTMLDSSPGTTPKEIGEILRTAQNASWSETTTKSTGRHFRSWARSAGISTSHGRKRPKAQPANLFNV